MSDTEMPEETFTVVEFDKIFGPEMDSESLSRKFIKKLVVIAVASIAYVRFLFPQDAFHHVECEGARFVMFKEKAVSGKGMDGCSLYTHSRGYQRKIFNINLLHALTMNGQQHLED